MEFFREMTTLFNFYIGNKLHLECEIEALPRPEIKWYRNDEELSQSEKYQFYRAIQPTNPNIHFVRLTIVVGKFTSLHIFTDFIILVHYIY